MKPRAFLNFERSRIYLRVAEQPETKQNDDAPKQPFELPRLGNGIVRTARVGAMTAALPPAHVRLLNLLSAIRQMAPISALSAEEELVLRELVVAWHERGEIKVGDLMRGARNESATTAYRRVVGLEKKGLVTLRLDQKDRRVKYVEPTAHARHYVDCIRDGLREIASAELKARQT